MRAKINEGFSEIWFHQQFTNPECFQRKLVEASIMEYLAVQERMQYTPVDWLNSMPVQKKFQVDVNITMVDMKLEFLFQVYINVIGEGLSERCYHIYIL